LVLFLLLPNFSCGTTLTACLVPLLSTCPFVVSSRVVAPALVPEFEFEFEVEVEGGEKGSWV